MKFALAHEQEMNELCTCSEVMGHATLEKGKGKDGVRGLGATVFTCSKVTGHVR